MQFFRGFIRLNGKKSIDKFKDTDVWNYDSVKDYPSYAGVLSPETVVIDVDDETQANKLLDIIEAEDIKCLVSRTTRGLHFFFKNDGTWEKCSTESTLALGIKADVKVGTSNSYAVLKKDGVLREIIYDIYEDEDYDAPPVWLRRVHTNIDLDGTGEGDGRNEKLFRYIMPLQTAGMTKDEIRATLRIVNKYIFEKPLSKSEFETITRDEAFETALVPEFYDGKVFLFEKLAQYLIQEFHIKRINEQLHVYDDGIYVDGTKKIERKMLELVPNLPDAKRQEVLKYIDVWVEEEASIGKANYVAFENGVLDVDTGNLMGFSPDIVVVNRIPWNYREGVRTELVDNTLTKLACGDEQIRSLLEEMVGYCMYRRNELRKAFILTGDKGNGKSTFIDMISAMLGNGNYASLDLKDLNHPFRPAMLFRKLANLGDDIDDDFIRDTAVFKKFVSGDPVTVEKKNKDPFTFVNYAKMIFSANTIPRIRDRTGAVMDRLIIIPFNARFSRNDPDYRPFIKDELRERENIEALISLGIDALKRVLARKRFTSSEAVERELEEFNETNNPILGFFKDVRADESVLDRESVSEIYSKYIEFCAVNQCQPMSRIQFGKQIVKEFDLESYQKKIDGKVVRFYKRRSLSKTRF